MKHPTNGLSQNDSHHKNVNRDKLFKGRTHVTMGEAWKILFTDYKNFERS